MSKLPAIQIVLCCAMAVGQEKPIPQPQLLEPSGEKVVGVPAFGFFAPARSDSAGDVFLHPAPFQEANILEISPSSRTTVYRLPSDVASKTSFYDYSVTPSGSVWILLDENGSPQLRAVRLDGQGEVTDTVRPQVPGAIQATNFLALENDFIMISGIYTKDAPEALRGHSFLGLFDNSGNLVRNIGNAFGPMNLNGQDSGRQPEGGCVPGDDGNAYFIGENEILALNAGGEIVKRIHFEKPIASMRTTGLYVSQGEALVRLAKMTGEHSADKSYLTIDLSTGEAVGWYALSNQKPRYNDVGFTRKEGIALFANDEGRLKIAWAQVR